MAEENKGIDPTTVGLILAVGVFVLVVFVWIPSAFGVTQDLKNGATPDELAGGGGSASGTCLALENGTAVSSDDLNKIIASEADAYLLKDKGAKIYDYASKERVNPLLSLAIAKNESNFGLAYANNPSSKYGACKNMLGMDWSDKYVLGHEGPLGGASGRHRIACFDDWVDGFIENIRLLRRAYFDPSGAHYSEVRSYMSRGESQLLALLEVYSPYSDGNNPAGYSRNVTKWMKGWCKLVGR
jgi:hypothetical protein